MGLGPLSKADPRLSLLGIVSALPEEAECLAGYRPRPESLLSISESVWLKLSGLGRDRAARAATVLVEKGAGALVSWGMVAGLAPHLRPGQLVIPTSVIATGGEEIFVDAHWRRRLCATLTREVLDVSLAETIDVLVDRNGKSQLAGMTGAAAADMESAAVAHIANQSGVSSLVVRVVVDPLWMTVPSSAVYAMSPTGARSLAGLVRGLSRRPAEIVTICRLASAFARARRSLKRVARLVGPEFLAFETEHAVADSNQPGLS